MTVVCTICDCMLPSTLSMEYRRFFVALSSDCIDSSICVREYKISDTLHQIETGSETKAYYVIVINASPYNSKEVDDLIQGRNVGRQCAIFCLQQYQSFKLIAYGGKLKRKRAQIYHLIPQWLQLSQLLLNVRVKSFVNILSLLWAGFALNFIKTCGIDRIDCLSSSILDLAA